MSKSKIIDKSDSSQHFELLPSVNLWQQMEETFDKFFNHPSLHQADRNRYVSTEMDAHSRLKKNKEK